MNPFINTIEVDVNPEYFYFRRPGKEIRVEPTVYLSQKGKSFLVEAVGLIDNPPESLLRVDLFKPGKHALHNSECFEAFLKYCIRMVIARNVLLRPRIIFRRSESLRDILCGYERQVLRDAVLRAGARDYVFQER